ncbi:ATP synthase F1 subcomplex gamma subunit [Draconibacterium orientale]|uniref:ATP synthase gamma chain n=1 Tax=Draconibacterium orientale TaxID=1168034 RepID=X5DWS6_9BACT|nr:ATP synthase F1 subunit gamma [Draconibacterium orientale]AHW59670.1 ATP F0F1 synthase subunit gamma [Draconibacterium orientale]SES79908.1 ATP synthase F1 subcomplex gamma subunit [Draconibacterium orientale]
MAGLKEIRTRIASVKTTRQVTSAMKMVSAAKLKKAQDAILQIRPYAEKLHEILTSLSASLENVEDSVYTQSRMPENVLLILVSSNRGLCGGFNSNISKKAIEVANTKYARQLQLGNLDFMCIGKQGARQLKHRGYKVVADENELFDELTFDNVSRVAEECMKSFADKHYDRIELVYNQFKNAAVQVQAAEQFLPVEMEEGEDNGNFDFIYEPSKEHIIRELIPRSLKIQFYKALLDSNAAEHGARMTAMHQATDNATELIGSLTLEYNKARQAAITGEILEIVSGAEALNG